MADADDMSACIFSNSPVVGPQILANSLPSFAQLESSSDPPILPNQAAKLAQDCCDLPLKPGQE